MLVEIIYTKGLIVLVTLGLDTAHFDLSSLEWKLGEAFYTYIAHILNTYI